MIVGFGARLRELREKKGLTQAQLASQLQLTKSVISAYETDARLPSYDVLLALSRIFNVKTDFLLGNRDSKWSIDVSGLTDEEVNAIITMIDLLKNK